MEKFEGGRRPACYIHDLIKALPNCRADAMTAEELADKNHWYSDAVEAKLSELQGMIHRGSYTGIRIWVVGKDRRFWLEDVDEEVTKAAPLKIIPKPEPKPEPKKVAWKPAKKKTTRLQEFLEKMPRSREEAVTVEDLENMFHVPAKTIHNRLTNLKAALKRGPFNGVSGQLGVDKVSKGGNSTVSGHTTTITIAYYWIEEDGLADTSDHTPEQETVPEQEPFQAEPQEVDEIVQPEETMVGGVKAAFEGEEIEPPGVTTTGYIDQPVTRPPMKEVCIVLGESRPVPESEPEPEEATDGPNCCPPEGTPRFEYWGRAGQIRTPKEDGRDKIYPGGKLFTEPPLNPPEPVPVIELTAMEMDTLLDMCYTALKAAPGLRAWYRLMDKLEGVAP